MKEIVLDTETTGLSVKDGHRIVEIGCIELDDLVPTTNTFHCYLNPERKVSEKAFEVHGYSDEFLSSQKKFFEISDELANQIRPHRNMFQRRKGELSDVLNDDDLTNKLSKFGLGVDKGIDEKFIEKVTPELLYSNITDILKDIALDRSQGGKGRKRPEYENTILLEYDFGDDEWLGPYVSYGWFEDNLLLPFVSAVNGKNELTFIIFLDVFKIHFTFFVIQIHG